MNNTSFKPFRQPLTIRLHLSHSTIWVEVTSPFPAFRLTYSVGGGRRPIHQCPTGKKRKSDTASEQHPTFISCNSPPITIRFGD